MIRSKLKNVYNNNPTLENWSLYKKQRNYCVKLLRKEKQIYYNNLDLKVFENNKLFWKRIKPLFSDKQKGMKSGIVLIDNNVVISDPNCVAEKLNNFFIDAVDNLNIEHFLPKNNEDTINKNTGNITGSYISHPSILKIKEHINVKNMFSFDNITALDIQKAILELIPKSSSKEDDIPVNIILETKELISEILAEIYNDSKNCHDFPKSLKLAEILPIFKKADRSLMNNYRPISLLPVVSKIFERIMYTQILAYIEKYLSPFLFGFRKGHSSEQCLVVMLESWKKALDKKNVQGPS